MILKYWICEHKDKGAHMALRFATREEFDKHVEEAGIRAFVRECYELPREVTVEGENVIEVIRACLDKESHQLLPWER